jgi:hypothetical protein
LALLALFIGGEEENPSHVWHSPSVATASVDGGTIRTSRGKACYKSPYPPHQLLVFFALARYRVVKIVCSYSEVVLQTRKNSIVYRGLGPFLEVIVLHPAV